MIGPAEPERLARLATRWASVPTRVGCPDPPAPFTSPVPRYREPHRAYHTDQHLDECLDWLDQVADQARDPLAVELAIWYHDAVYQPRASDNEAASALLATEQLRLVGVAEPLIAVVGDLILHTSHRAPPPSGDPALLVDIDLAILGAAEPRYAEYEGQVRQEYRWVPGFVFRRRRAELLREFLDRPRLYATPFFGDRLESAARRNLTGAIAKLEDSR